MDDGAFGEDVARRYDAVVAQDAARDPSEAVACLAALADGGDALEFAIGTGRVALPLATAGVVVEGIELSQAMIGQLRAKPGGEALRVERGDMTTVEMGRRYRLVYLVFNTIDNLTSQEAQVACFANAARHLEPGGRFVVETLVPPLRRMPPGTRRIAQALSDDHWCVDDFDLATQRYSSNHLHRTADGLVRHSVPFRYAWPAEMDLMARMAGMALEHRWSDWRRADFADESEMHVSVWRKRA